MQNIYTSPREMVTSLWSNRQLIRNHCCRSQSVLGGALLNVAGNPQKLFEVRAVGRRRT